jgi:hypothetical protein
MFKILSERVNNSLQVYHVDFNETYTCRRIYDDIRNFSTASLQSFHFDLHDFLSILKESSSNKNILQLALGNTYNKFVWQSMIINTLLKIEIQDLRRHQRREFTTTILTATQFYVKLIDISQIYREASPFDFASGWIQTIYSLSAIYKCDLPNQLLDLVFKLLSDYVQTHDSTKIDILTIIPFVSNILTFFARNLIYDKPNDIHVNALHKYVCAWVLSIIIRDKYNSISTWTHLLTTLTIRLKECDPSPSKDIAAILFWYYIFESLNDFIQKQTELFADSSLLQILIHSCAPSYQAHIQSVVLKLVEHSKCEYTFDILLKCNITPDMLSTVVLERESKTCYTP